MKSMDVGGALQEGGMLTYGPASYPKCKLNILPFINLLHPSECFICCKEMMIIVLLQKNLGGLEGSVMVNTEGWEGTRRVGREHRGLV